MVTILKETTKNPITLMGERAGICWGSDISDPEKNYKRGLECLEKNHGRVLEFVNVEMIIDGYSAKCMREWYTHIGCLPSRLQSSTRYIDYSKGNGFDYTLPQSVANNEVAYKEWLKLMSRINSTISFFINELNIPIEDATMMLPLAYDTRIVDKRNLRNLIDMSHQRMCSRAYWEYRELFADICDELVRYSEEWAYIVVNYFKPKCRVLGYCPEKIGCISTK